MSMQKAAMKPIILVIDGSPRKQSSSRALALSVAKRIEELGAAVRVFRQDENLLPIFDDEQSSAQHPAVQQLFACMRDVDCVVLSSPEYHNSMSGALKNALDWLSLLPDNVIKPMILCGLIGGGGAMGNSGALLQMMMAVRSMKWWLMPDVMLSVSNIWDAFENTELNSQSDRERLESFCSKLLHHANMFSQLREAA